MRDTGIDIIASCSWGTHFCQFYQTPEDLIGILVPYFKAGLEGNESCLWITSPPLSRDEAEAALSVAVCDLDGYRDKGQIEILPYSEWYLQGGSIDLQRVLRGWHAKLEQAGAGGFDGLRVSCNTAWLEKKDWKAFVEYEAAADNFFGHHRMIALCTYFLDQCRGPEILDVVRNHQFALIKNEKGWDLLEPSEVSGGLKMRHAGEFRHRSVVEFAASPVGDDNGKGNPVARRNVAGRGQVEDKLAWLASFPERSPSPLVEVDLGSESIHYINPAAMDLFPDLAARGLLHPWLAGVPAMAKTMCETGERAARREVWFGERCYQQSVSFPSADQRVRIHGADITPLKEALIKLEHQTTRLREQTELLDLAPVFARDLEDRIILWSRGAERLYGWTKADAMGMVSHQRLLTVFPQPLEEIRARLFESGSWEGELVHTCKSGARIKTACQWVLHRNESGRPVAILEANNDVSELRKVGQRFNLMAETASELLASDSPQTVIDTLCRKVLAFLECDVFFNFLADEKNSCLHLNACGGVPEEEARRMEWLMYGTAVCGCAARDGCRIVCEYVQETEDPRTVLVKPYGIRAYACHPLVCQGNILGTLSFGARGRDRFSDDELSLMKAVADQVAIAIMRRKSEEALRRTAEELTRSNRELEQFAYVASHDLQEPLRAVAGYVELLKRRHSEELDPDALKYIAGAAEGADRMQKLIIDLLEFASLRKPGGRLELTDLNEALDKALLSLATSIHETGARITVDALPTLRVHGMHMVQLFQNLVGNAIKFRSGNPPDIRVSAAKKSGQWLFSIQDNGIGIDPQYAERIFMIFKRLHTRLKYPGNGIGLALCKKIVESYGGTIWVESQPEAGSTFYFTLSQGEMYPQ